MAEATPKPDNEPWSDCPPGEVGGLVDRLQRRHRSEQQRQVAAGIACLAVVLMAGFYAIPRLGLGGAGRSRLVCADVHRLANDYVGGHLDQDLTDRIELHLQRCVPCREVVEELQSSQADSRSQHPAAVGTVASVPGDASVRTDLVALSLGSL